MGILNNKVNVDQIREEIKRYIEENDNGDVDPVILWDAMKAVICGKLIALTTTHKKGSTSHIQTQSRNIERIGEKHQNTEDPLILQQIKETRGEIDEILGGDKKGKICKADLL